MEGGQQIDQLVFVSLLSGTDEQPISFCFVSTKTDGFAELNKKLHPL